MTRDEWVLLRNDLHASFVHGLPVDRGEVLWKRYASQMTKADFMAVMDVLIETSPHAPTPADFRAEYDRQHGNVALPWTDVWPIAQEAAHRCGRKNANQAVLDWATRQGVRVDGAVARDITTGEPGNVSAETIATMVVRARAGRVAADWFASYGRAQILAPSASFGDEQYGTRAIRVLGESYEQHASYEPARNTPAPIAAAPSFPELDA